MMKFKTTETAIGTIKHWHDVGTLDLRPNFQRRFVWSDKARSYLIDTVLRGKPIPAVYIRFLENTDTGRSLRQVVDGQQRLRTVLDFIQDGFPIDKAHYEEFGGKYFTQLEQAIRDEITQYPFSIVLLMDAPDSEVYDIFARLNRYPVKINAQEYRNSQYFGEFKTTTYELAFEFTTFWLQNSIFTDKEISRMAEAEFTADLLIAMSEGIKSRNKAVIDKAFKDHDNEFPRREILADRFRELIDLIAEMMEDYLKESCFHRDPLFYSLFCAIYHMQYGVPGLKLPRKRIGPTALPKIRVDLEKVDAIFEIDKSEVKQLPAADRRFREATDVHTIHASNRLIRAKYLNRLILRAVQK